MSISADAGSQSAASSLHDNAINVLLCIKSQEDEKASTTTIREATGLSAANISGHHAQTLIREGYVERAGSEPGDAPRDANVYTLTHRGRKEANNLLKARQAPMSDAEMVKYIRQLQDRVEELEEMVEQPSGPDVKEQVDSNTAKIEEHESTLKTVHNILEKHLL